MNVNITAGLRRELAILISWLIFIFILGGITGKTLAVLCIGLIIYTIWTLYNLNRLSKWLTKPSKNTPETWGVWDDVYYQLYHLYKRQRKARRKLTKILNRFQQSTQALPYATIVLNNSDEIEWFNPAASQMFSLRHGLDIGQRIDNLIRQPEFAHYISRREFEVPLEFQLHHKRILLSMTSYGGGQYLLSASDITQRVKLDEMRRDFISNASHELRTPITVMLGYIEMLNDTNDETLKLPLEKIYLQTVRMEKIIAELIELAKLEASETADKSQTVNTEVLMDEIRNEALALDQGKHNIEFSIEDVHINGVYDELRMAFSNLITNAIRYTPENGSIEFFAYEEDVGVSVGVKDQGAGISYEHIPRLTERFYRVDEGRSSEKGGTGLGLAIVKQVLDRHGASLYIESTVGKGSVFRCYFPH